MPRRRVCRGIAVWRVSDGMNLYEFAGAGGDSFAILPDGKTLVVEDEKAGTISFARLQDGTILKTIQRPAQGEGLLSSFLPTGQLYAVGASGSDIRVWQFGKDAPLYTINVGPFEWTTLAFSPDRKHLVMASDAILVRKVSDGALLYKLPGQYFIRRAGCSHRMVPFWSLRMGQPINCGGLAMAGCCVPWMPLHCSRRTGGCWSPGARESFNCGGSAMEHCCAPWKALLSRQPSRRMGECWSPCGMG